MPVPQLKVIRHRPPKYIRDRKKKKYTVWIKKLIKLGFVAFLLLVIYLVGAFAWYSRSLPDPSKLLDRDVAQSTKIYDRTGEEIVVGAEVLHDGFQAHGKRHHQHVDAEVRFGHVDHVEIRKSIGEWLPAEALGERVGRRVVGHVGGTNAEGFTRGVGTQH